MTRKILIVEDTPTIARVQKHIALKAGYEVDIAESLAATKELIKHNSYFCAVVDFILPDAPAGEAIPYTCQILHIFTQRTCSLCWTAGCRPTHAEGKRLGASRTSAVVH